MPKKTKTLRLSDVLDFEDLSKSRRRLILSINISHKIKRSTTGRGPVVRSNGDFGSPRHGFLDLGKMS